MALRTKQTPTSEMVLVLPYTTRHLGLFLQTPMGWPCAFKPDSSSKVCLENIPMLTVGLAGKTKVWPFQQHPVQGDAVSVYSTQAFELGQERQLLPSRLGSLLGRGEKGTAVQTRPPAAPWQRGAPWAWKTGAQQSRLDFVSNYEQVGGWHGLWRAESHPTESHSF